MLPFSHTKKEFVMGKLWNKTLILVIGVLILAVQVILLSTKVVDRSNFYLVNALTNSVIMVTPEGKKIMNYIDDSLSNSSVNHHSH